MFFAFGSASGAACGGEGDSGACSNASGTICTWAGTGDPAFDGDGKHRQRSALYWVTDLEIAPDGRAYVLDWQNHRVRRVNADQRFETVVGTDTVGDGPEDQGDFTPAGAPGTTINLNHPTDLQFLPGGVMLIAAWHNHKLRRFDPVTGVVHVSCGSGPGFVGDGGPAAQALLNMPKAIAVSSITGEIFVVDTRNARVRKIAPDGVGDDTITTVAGTGMLGYGGDDGPALSAAFKFQSGNMNPEPGGGITLDADGVLYVADTENHRVRSINLATGAVATVAGTGVQGDGGDGGPAITAQLDYPRDLELGPDGRLYVADTDNHRVRAIDRTTGTIATVAGTGQAGFSGDGGHAKNARLQRPFGIAFDADGALYIADTMNSRVRRVTP